MLPAPRNTSMHSHPSYDTPRVEYETSSWNNHQLPSYHDPPPSYPADRRRPEYPPRQETYPNYPLPSPLPPPPSYGEPPPPSYAEADLHSPGPVRRNVISPRQRSRPYPSSRSRHEYSPSARTYPDQLPPFNYEPSVFSPTSERGYASRNERRGGMDFQGQQFQPPPHPPPTTNNEGYFPSSSGYHGQYDGGYRGGG